MGFRNIVNDGTNNAPRLRLQSALVINGPIAERLDRIAAEGFKGVDVVCGSEREADEVGALAHQRGLGIGLLACVAEVDDLLAPIDFAQRLRADYISARVSGSLKASPEIADILEEMFELVNDAGLPLFIETRRGTVTQDLRRTVKVVDRFKKVRFAGDFGQYLVAADISGAWSEEVWEHFRPIAVRCGKWIGRIDHGGEESLEQYKKLLQMGMSAWLKKAEAGDVLPFSCESGSIAKRLAEEAWAAAEIAALPAEPEAVAVEVNVVAINRAVGEASIPQ